MDAPEAGYQLGSDAVELERLNRQGMVLAPATRMILQGAGIGLGMRVLDLGSGTGDVAFVAAELVGPAGGADELAASQAVAAHPMLLSACGTVG